MAIFYTDVAAATEQYVAARDTFPDLCCDIVTVGLGSAYKLSCEGNAMVVPGAADLRGAGAPEGAQPMGQELPLFACMELRHEGDDGPKVPLYVSHADCAAAVAQAPGRSLEIDAVLSLQDIVQELAGLDDLSSSEFSFVPASAAMQHISSYVGQGVYLRKVDEDAD